MIKGKKAYKKLITATSMTIGIQYYFTGGARNGG